MPWLFFQIAPESLSRLSELLLRPLMAYPVVGFLLLLILVDIVTGVISAFITHKLNSNTSFAGMGKKVLMTLVICAGKIFDALQSNIAPNSEPLPCAKLIASYYCLHELLSILENVDRAGVPIPGWLKVRLQKSQTIIDSDDGKPRLSVNHADKIIVQSQKTQAVTESQSMAKVVLGPTGEPISDPKVPPA